MGLARRACGEIVLIGAHIHTALDMLLGSIDRSLDPFAGAAQGTGLTLPPITVAKVHSIAPQTPSGGRIRDFPIGRCIGEVTNARGSVAIIGGTTSARLSMMAQVAPALVDWPRALVGRALSL